MKDFKLLAIYLDSIVVDAHHVVGAIGVDEAGDKHLLGLAAPGPGPAAGVPVRHRRSKALRSTIGEIFGERAHVQRCRTHKLRNVLERLPKEQRAQTKAVM